MIIVAAVSGALATYIGLLISYHADLAAGASIVLSAVALFSVTAIVREIQASLRRAQRADHELPHQHTHIHLP